MEKRARIDFDSKSDPDHVIVTITFLNREALGLTAEFALIAECRARHGESVNEQRFVLVEQFEVGERPERFRIPRRVIRNYSYSGSKINMVIMSRLILLDGLIYNSTMNVEHDLGIGARTKAAPQPRTVAAPPDKVRVRLNFRSLAPRNKVLVSVLAVFALAPWITVGFVHVSLLAGVFHPLTILGGLIAGLISYGFVLWIRRVFGRYLRSRRLPFPGRVRRNSVIRIPQLFTGVSLTNLRDVTLRIVAFNVEKGKRATHSGGRGSGRESFAHVARAVVIYEKKLDIIPRDRLLETFFDDAVDFSKVFSALYPPNVIDIDTGVFLEWKLQLLSPDFVDVELKLPPDVFAAEEFFSSSSR